MSSIFGINIEIVMADNCFQVNNSRKPEFILVVIHSLKLKA